jgi:GTP-binding protein
MLVKDAFLDACEVDIRKYPSDGLFEIVLIGNPTSAKSSFINAMTERKALARTSGAPAKDAHGEFLPHQQRLLFCGYARIRICGGLKNQKASFETIIRTYLRRRESDFAVFFLLDSRHAPTKNDLAAYALIKNEGIMPVIILTKTDKQKTYVTNANAR